VTSETPNEHDEAPDTIEDSVRERRAEPGAPRTYLFIVLEGDRPLAGGARFSLAGIDEVLVVRGVERRAQVDRDARSLTLHIPSPSLSRLHARLRRTPLGWSVEDAGSRNGCYVNGQRIERARATADDLIEMGHAFLVVRDVEQRADEPARDLDAANVERDPPGWRTLVPNIAASLEELRRIAVSPLGVLLIGETGTGKEMLARAIHQLSARPGPFVAINCNTLTDGLAESQLFGHVKGAFSGAIADATGYIRAANRGTLLLDEVGDLSAAAQGALLRVLQEREVVPVGRAQAVTVDVRFLATSPVSLAGDRDRFRSDLFARLTGFVYAMTPLRERREDLGLLIAALLRKAGVGEGDRPRIAPDLALGLLRHDWPLNVRELEQLLLRSWLLASGGLMCGAPRFVHTGDDDARAARSQPSRPSSPEDAALQQRVSEELAAAGGNVTMAARALGTSRVQLHRVMKRLGVDPRRFRRQVTHSTRS
jgi:DNA-binding NtrC family response regulator